MVQVRVRVRSTLTLIINPNLAILEQLMALLDW